MYFLDGNCELATLKLASICEVTIRDWKLQFIYYSADTSSRMDAHRHPTQACTYVLISVSSHGPNPILPPVAETAIFGLILYALHGLIFDFFLTSLHLSTLRLMLGLDDRYKTARVYLTRKGGESGELGGLSFTFFFLVTGWLLIDSLNGNNDFSFLSFFLLSWSTIQRQTGISDTVHQPCPSSFQWFIFIVVVGFDDENWYVGVLFAYPQLMDGGVEACYL